MPLPKAVVGHAPDRLLSLRDTARVLGVSVKTLRRLYDAKELTVIRIGRQVRVAPADLERFIAERRRS